MSIQTYLKKCIFLYSGWLGRMKCGVRTFGVRGYIDHLDFGAGLWL